MPVDGRAGAPPDHVVVVVASVGGIRTAQALRSRSGTSPAGTTGAPARTAASSTGPTPPNRPPSSQAALVARDLVRGSGTAGERAHHASAPYFWSDQHGVTIQMAGRAAPGGTVEILRCATPAGERHVALYAREGRFAAAVAFGRPRAAVAGRQAWSRRVSAAEVRAAVAAPASVRTVPAPGPLADGRGVTPTEVAGRREGER